jgi:hypothetical protein
MLLDAVFVWYLLVNTQLPGRIVPISCSLMITASVKRDPRLSFLELHQEGSSAIRFRAGPLAGS